MKRPFVLLALVAGLAFAPASLAGASHAKFDFEGVTFPDGVSGEIYASSKTTGNGSMFTTCGYVAANGAFLGEYQDPTFASTDAGTLEQFCLDHYGDRVS